MPSKEKMAKWQRRRCKPIEFTRDRSKQQLLFMLKCYLSPGKYSLILRTIYGMLAYRFVFSDEAK